MTSRRSEEASATQRLAVALFLLALSITTGCGGTADVNNYTFNMPTEFSELISPDASVKVEGLTPRQTNITANLGGAGAGGPLVYGDPLDDQFNASFDPFNPPPELQNPPPSDWWP